MAKFPKALSLKEKIKIIREAECNLAKNKHLLVEELKIPMSILQNVLWNKDKNLKLFETGRHHIRRKWDRASCKSSVAGVVL